MYIVVIAWLYVVLMMSVAEATHASGTVLGAIITFVMYGLLPLSIVVYIMGTPARKRRLREKAAHEQSTPEAQAAAPAMTPAADSKNSENTPQPPSS